MDGAQKFSKVQYCHQNQKIKLTNCESKQGQSAVSRVSAVLEVCIHKNVQGCQWTCMHPHTPTPTHAPNPELHWTCGDLWQKVIDILAPQCNRGVVWTDPNLEGLYNWILVLRSLTPTKGVNAAWFTHKIALLLVQMFSACLLPNAEIPLDFSETP